MERDWYETTLVGQGCFLRDDDRALLWSSCGCLQLQSKICCHHGHSQALVLCRRVQFFYDDKYGFEPEATCSSAFEVSQKVHWWLGAQFDPKKLQLCFDPTILGVTYDLKAMHLKIKPSRKEELLDEIEAIINSQVFFHLGKQASSGEN